jgi:hypothetical protein
MLCRVDGLEFHLVNSKYLFRKALIVNFFCNLLFNVAVQPLHHFGGIGGRALSRCGSGSKGFSFSALMFDLKFFK